MDAEKNPNACPECGLDLETGEPPKPAPPDRRAHAIMHWGTDNPDKLDNPDARERAKKVLGNADAATREG